MALIDLRHFLSTTDVATRLGIAAHDVDVLVYDRVLTPTVLTKLGPLFSLGEIVRLQKELRRREQQRAQSTR